MMNKLFIPLLIFIACCQGAAAQKGDVDSLQKAYNKNHQDSTLLQLLVEKGRRIYLTTNTDSGMIVSRQALALAQKLHDKKGEVEAMAGIATFLNITGDLPGSLRETFAALPIALQINDKRVIASCYNTLGLTYSTLKDTKKSEEYYHKALAVAESAHEYELITVETNNISRGYLDNDQLDSALVYTNMSIAVSKKNNMMKNISYPIRNLGIIQFKKGRYKQAIDYYNKSIQNIPGNNNHYLLSEDYRRSAEAYKLMNQPDSCIYLCKKAFEEAKLDKNPELVLRATAILTDEFRSVNDFKGAYDYQQIMLKAQDSLFSQQKTLQIQNLTFNEEQRKRELEAADVAYQNRIRFYALLSILGVLLLIAIILLYANGQRKKANIVLRQRNEQIETQHKALEKTLSELKTTQIQLIQSEKMASLGELTAGIAHEIQNPLNFVNNFSEVNTELIDEMEQGIEKGDLAEIKTIAKNIKENEQKINMHGKRADAIVKNMLQHSKAGSAQKEPTNLNALADEYLRLAYHGLRSKDKSFNAELVTNFDKNLPLINAIPQDIGRVLLNLFNNAFYAVNQKSKTALSGYKPEISITTLAEKAQVIIKVKDNGLGIPDAKKDKIMQPFFTTKPTGEGTGLGLSLSYDIVVKGHSGTIQVSSKEGEGSEFIIILPVS